MNRLRTEAGRCRQERRIVDKRGERCRTLPRRTGRRASREGLGIGLRVHGTRGEMGMGKAIEGGAYLWSGAEEPDPTGWGRKESRAVTVTVSSPGSHREKSKHGRGGEREVPSTFRPFAVRGLVAVKSPRLPTELLTVAMSTKRLTSGVRN
jgi:hypothetical protein